MAPKSGGNRLDKLLELLETGTSAATRNAAAEQIVAVVAANPSQLPYVLRKVLERLRSAVWEARIAAGECLGYIAKHCVHHNAAMLCQKANWLQTASLNGMPDTKPVVGGLDPYVLSFRGFSADAVLMRGTLLLASGGKEYETTGDELDIVKQRKRLRKRLGVDGHMEELLDTRELVKDEDLIPSQQSMHSNGAATVAPATQQASELLSEMDGLSARERARLKRLAKKRPLQQQDGEGISKQSGGKRKKGDRIPRMSEEKVAAAAAAAAEQDMSDWAADEAGAWPFSRIADDLCTDVVDPNWHVRHGAAVGLRAILRSHAGAAAVNVPPADSLPSGWLAAEGSGPMWLGTVTPAIAEAASVVNRGWLEDCIVRLICVLALDRFADFVSDQVTAPVRETAAQALGAAVQPLSREALQALISQIARLAAHPQWEVRHSGLLALKYVVAARSDAAEQLLQPALDIAQPGLQDVDDDVRAVAATSLLPLAPVLLVPEQAGAVADLHHHLWHILEDSDELSPATGTAMQLLGSTTTASVAANGLLAQRLPRLLPYFRHTLASVRGAVLHCLSSLIQADPRGAHTWLQSSLQSVMRLTWQNLLQEANPAVAAASQQLWTLILRCVGPAGLTDALPEAVLKKLMMLACTPEGQPLPAAALLVMPQPQLQRTRQSSASANTKGPLAQGQPVQGQGLIKAAAAKAKGGSDRDTSPFVVGVSGNCSVLQMRVTAAVALGQLAAALGKHAGNLHSEIQQRLCSQSGHDRIVAAVSAAACAESLRASSQPDAPAGAQRTPNQLPSDTSQLLFALLQPGTSAAWSEVVPAQHRMQRQLAVMTKRCTAVGVALPSIDPAAATAADAVAVLSAVQNLSDSPSKTSLLSDSQPLAEAAAVCAAVEGALTCSVNGCVAAAAVVGAPLPAKLNAVIQPLMACIRKKAEPAIQNRAAAAIATLLQAAASREPCPNAKIVTNVCTMACSDPFETPSAAAPDPPLEASLEDGAPGAPSPSVSDPAAAAAVIARKGAEAALQAATRLFGARLLQQLPRLWELSTAALWHLQPSSDRTAADAKSEAPDAQAVINTLQILKVVGPVLDPALEHHLVAIMPAVGAAAQHTRSCVRTAAVAASAALAHARPLAILPPLLRYLVPMLGSDVRDAMRLTAVQLVDLLVRQLSELLVPYLQLVVVPLLARMSDVAVPVRSVAAPAFAAIVSLVPLSQGVEMPEALSKEQQAAWLRDASFLVQLLDSGAASQVGMPAALRDVTMRPYQQEGLSWLSFLRRSGLHGVLADDMGLGKTLQATAAMAVAQEDRAAAGEAALPSLVICPQTLVLHWAHEVQKFAGNAMQTLAYQGNPAVRTGLRHRLATTDLVIMSYETLRGDAEWVTRQQWLYAVLDEGHVIRNPKSKVAQACRALTACHRVILSGTPIQNNIGELWGLFDWIMPGFLGTQQAFQAKHGKALQAARTSKQGSQEAEAALLSLESLHKQIKPFILRRTKDQVLKDLPAKIIQDILVDPSPLQARLLADVSTSSVSANIIGALASSGGAAATEATPHVFQALQYMRKVCSHPGLVLDATNPSHCRALEAESLQLPLEDGLRHAPKLAALRELLAECGIGNTPGAADGEEGAGGVRHRVLVFAQLRALLDLVETEVLTPNDITWLRLDGGVEATRRYNVVQKFNSDPSVDVMLLTTAVGGLGLNLTAADTVVFLEHDWNPMKDLQAMDRAHRLGQKRTVNVYRLLVRGTLEEHIMGLQRFKLDVAGAVVNQDNVSMATMDTNKLLDLFTGEDQKAEVGTTFKGVNGMLQNLGELWDNAQYDELNSLEGFVKTLGPS